VSIKVYCGYQCKAVSVWRVLTPAGIENKNQLIEQYKYLKSTHFKYRQKYRPKIFTYFIKQNPLYREIIEGLDWNLDA
jgi:hypothetical protein